MNVRSSLAARALAFLVATLLTAACSGPILSNPGASPGAPIVKGTPRPVANDPQPIQLPRDDAPHDRLTEWWYVTGHLDEVNGTRRFGYEAVIFRAQRGDFPVTWASHVALTEKPSTGQRGSFQYLERSEVGEQVDVRALIDGPVAAAFAITGANPLDPSTLGNTPWSMVVGRDGSMQIGAAWLDLRASSGKPPALHDVDGFVAFDDAGGSYYYSRTRMPTAGSVMLNGERIAVTGSSWFDHQWGDFISVGGGGWDWFALNLSDGSDLMLSFVRAADGSYPLVYGSLVDARGATRHIAGSDIALAAIGEWTSARTATTWPSGWRLAIASLGLEVTIRPEVLDQELDTRATTGVIYWEGASRVVGSRNGRPIAGRAYVELTGYARAR